MGRRKIEIQPISDERNRTVTFAKRKAGLFKKAHELAILCNVDIALIIIGQNNKIYKYSSDSTETILNKFNVSNIEEDKSPDFYGDYQTQSRIGNYLSNPIDSSNSNMQIPNQSHKSANLSNSLTNSIVTQLHNDVDHQDSPDNQIVNQLVSKRLLDQSDVSNDMNKRVKYSSTDHQDQPATPPQTTSTSNLTSLDPKMTPFNQNTYLKRHTRSLSKNRPSLSLQIPDKEIDNNSGKGNNNNNNNNKNSLPLVTPTTQYINNIVNQTELPSALSGYFNLNISPVQTSTSSNSFMFPQPNQQHQQQSQQQSQMQQQQQQHLQQSDSGDSKNQQPQQMQFQQPPIYHPMNSASSMYFPKKMSTPNINGPLSSLQVSSGMYNNQTPTLSAFKDMQSPNGYFNQDNWPNFPIPLNSSGGSGGGGGGVINSGDMNKLKSEQQLSSSPTQHQQQPQQQQQRQSQNQQSSASSSS